MLVVLHSTVVLSSITILHIRVMQVKIRCQVGISFDDFFVLNIVMYILSIISHLVVKDSLTNLVAGMNETWSLNEKYLITIQTT